MRNYILGFVIFFLAIGISSFVIHKKSSVVQAPPPLPVIETPPVVMKEGREIIGKSVEGREIEVYTYGDGPVHLLFVGGIHGGYEWNSSLLAYQVMDYLHTNQGVVPKNITVAIIPSANPDGLYRVIKKEGQFGLLDVPEIKQPLGTGRFNANDVDLNRNFDCKWKRESMWQRKVVSAGSKAFSEPEAATIRDYVAKFKPVSVVFWHSKANGVYASLCKSGILPKTIDVMNSYAKASGYPAIKTFDAYEVTGDAEGWLASIGIPAITVELKSHEGTELKQNLAGVRALFEYFK